MMDPSGTNDQPTDPRENSPVNDEVEVEDETDAVPLASEQGGGGTEEIMLNENSASLDRDDDHDDDAVTGINQTSNNGTSTTIASAIVDDNQNSIWWTLTASVLLGLVSGTLYGFGRYSRALRDTLGISQLQIERFGILLDNGNYVGHPLTGLFYDRMGPKVSCCCAALIVFISYGSIHLGLLSSSSSSSDAQEQKQTLIWIIDIAFFGVGFGGGLGYIAALGSTTRQFLKVYPNFVGRAVGLVSAGIGFSSTLVGITYYFVGLDYFFLLWAILIAVVNIIGAIIFTNQQTLSSTTTISPSTHHRTQADDDHNYDDEERNIIESSDNENATNNSLEEPLLSSVENNYADTRVITSTEQSPQQQQQPAWVSWKRLDFWQLFAAFACITGCGLFVINNISTMVQSIGEPDGFAGGLVILLSIFNVSGRVFVGLLADSPVDWFGSNINKRTLLRYASILMAIGLLTSATLASPLDDDDDAAASTRRYRRLVLTSTVTMVALAYGACWVLIVGIITDLYGKSHFGKDYGVIAMGPALSGLVFNSASAWLYQRNANAGSGVCIGNQCYQESFYLTAGAALVGYALLTFMPTRPAATNINTSR